MGIRLENLKHQLRDDLRKMFFGPMRGCPYCKRTHAVKSAEWLSDNRLVMEFSCQWFGQVKITYELTERWKAEFF